MRLSLKRLCCGFSCIYGIFCSCAWANDDPAEDSISTRLSNEVYAAVSDLKQMANSVRGDKIGKKLQRKLKTAESTSLRSIAVNERTTSYRASTKTTSFLTNSEARYNDSALINDYSRLDTYIRMDNTSINDNVSLQKGTEQEQSGYSLTLGGDYLFNEHYLFGLTLGLPFYKPLTENSENEIDGMIASGYFSYFRNAWYVDFTASYAVMDTDIERQVTLYSDTVVNNTNEVDSDIWVFSLGSGYIFDYNYLNVALESNLQYTLSDTDRYAERVSLSNSNYLISKVDNINALESTMLISGLSISHPLRTPFGVFQPYAKAYVHYDIASGNERIISQLKSNHSGSILPIVVESDDNFYGRFHLGISGAFNQDWYGYAEASQLFEHDDLSAYTISVGLSVA
ncbi:autotransporter outer membrane beta-barrel domain-containing protein, partial [Photobacterium makurazakiensis]|uniref:autotransporter domain-containing protein n=1 Tax=Photobacterium makurazakiensis TaxID=2910234 RepID=UPI003D129CC0